MKERKHKILNHPILGYFLLMLFALIITQVISAIIDNMILARFISGYAFTQTIAGTERTQATGVGNAAGAAGIFWGLYLVRPAKRSEIVELWKSKWSAKTE